LRTVLIVKMGTTLPSLVERRGDFDDWMRRPMGLASDRIRVVKPYEKEDLPDPSGLSGVIITGSHDMVTDRKEWSERTGAWLPSVIKAGVPLLGQLSEHSAQDPLFDGFPPIIRVHVSHTQSVLSLPPKSTLLASSSKDPHQAYALGENVWGVQFHPEFDADIVGTYIKECADDLSAEGLNPEHLLGTLEDTPYGESLLRRFGEIVNSRS